MSHREQVILQILNSIGKVLRILFVLYLFLVGIRAEKTLKPPPAVQQKQVNMQT
jgi:hypothetical protein